MTEHVTALFDRLLSGPPITRVELEPKHSTIADYAIARVGSQFGSDV